MDPTSPESNSSNLNIRSSSAGLEKGNQPVGEHILINWFCANHVLPAPSDLLELTEKKKKTKPFIQVLLVTDVKQLIHTQASHAGSGQIVLKSNMVKLSGTSLHQLPRYIIDIINLSYLAPI